MVNLLKKIKLSEGKEQIIEIIFKSLFLFVGFLQTNNITFGKSIISFFLWPTVFLGIFILIYRLINIKDYYKSKGLILLILFTVSLCISSILFRQYGLYENVRKIAWIVYQFGILYAYDYNKEQTFYKKQFEIICCIFIATTLILTVISLVQMLIGYSYYIPKTVGPSIVYGFTWGRLFGAYWDPNIASVMACISILISTYLIKNRKNKLNIIFNIVNIILQLIYIAFSDSRTGRLCLAMGLFSLIIMYIIRIINENKENKKKNIGKKIVIICSILVMIISPKVIKNMYNISQKKPITVTQKESINYSEEQENQKLVGREEDIKDDISNRRFDIWKSAFEIYKENLFFGVSRQNIIAYAKDNMQDTYIVNNDHMDFDSMHNLVFDILVSQGTIGIIIFLSFAICIFINIIKNYKLFIKERIFYLIIPIICTVLTATLVMTEIIYVDSPISTVFWMGLGYLMYNVSKNRKEELYENR